MKMPVDSTSKHARRRATMLLLDHRRRARGADCFAVCAAIDFAANASYFVNHAKAVTHDCDFARGIVVPAHGNLAQAQLSEVCQVNQFDIKTKPIDLRGFNYRAAHTHAERLETALRVPERQSGSHAYDEIEN